MKLLIYSSSGCSSSAQMANYLAVQLDGIGEAEMSFIARVGGKVIKIVRTALSGRKIITMDSCPLSCSKACLSNHAISPDVHIEHTQYRVRKQNHIDFDRNETNVLFNKIKEVVSSINTIRLEAMQCDVN